MTLKLDMVHSRIKDKNEKFRSFRIHKKDGPDCTVSDD